MRQSIAAAKGDPHRLRYIDMPVHTQGAAPTGSLLGGAGLAVVTSSARVPEAGDFAFWVAGREARCGVYFDGGGQPGHAAAWDDDRDLIAPWTGVRALVVIQSSR